MDFYVFNFIPLLPELIRRKNNQNVLSDEDIKAKIFSALIINYKNYLLTLA